MIRAVIFDLDNVLADSEKLHFEAFSKTLSGVGIKIDAGTFKRFVLGKSSKKGMENLVKHYKIKQSLAKLLKIKQGYFLELAVKLKPVRGSMVFLRSVYGRFRLALATGSPRVEVDVMLDKLQLRDYFDAIITVEDITMPKPDPQIYLKAAKILGVHPEDCVVVEDSPAGVESAKSAGMMCIAIPTSVPIDELKKADIILNDFSEAREVNSLLSLASIINI